MASNITERARSYFGYAAPQYDFERTLQWTYGDKYYLQASQKGFQDMFDTKTTQQRGPVVEGNPWYSKRDACLLTENDLKELFKVRVIITENRGIIKPHTYFPKFELTSQKLMEIAKQALKNGEIIIAEKSLGNAIRKEKLENISSERNPESYYYLAEVLQAKAFKGDVELLQRQRFLLQAASLYNFVRNCWEKSAIESDFSKNMPNIVSRRLLDIQDSLVLSAGGNPLCCMFDSESKKNVLENLRKEAKCCLETMNIAYDEHEAGSEEGLRNIFVKQQTVEIRGLFKKIASVIKQLLAEIIQECLEVLGKPPCNYEVIVLGSLAREEMTPYSDLEWAIITSSEEEQCKVYFRNLTNLVHLQIINLGETILPNMDIEALKCEWFYDDVTPRGVSFDGLLPQASKTPLGNTTDFELIHNPAKMADFQSNYWYKKNPGLGEILLTVAPLEDNKHPLVDEYRIEVERILSRPCDLDGCVHGVSSDKQPNQGTCRGLVTLKQDVSRYGEMILGSDQINDGKLYDVKKEIYRLTDRVVAGLAKYFCVGGNGAFEVLDKLYERGVIGSSGRDNLASAVGVALKLRLSTYLEAGKQQEEIKAKPDEAVVNSDSAHTYAYHMPREKELFHFFYVAIPLYEKLYRFFPNDENLSDTFLYDIFFDCSDAVKGHIYCRVLNYTEARNSYERALEVDPGNIDLELRQIRIEFMVNEKSQDVAAVKQKLDALLLEMRKRYNLPELTMTTESGEIAVAEFDSCCDLIKCELQTPIDGSQLLDILYFTALFHQVQGNFETARAILYQCSEMDKKRLSLDYLQKLMITLSLLELTLMSGLQLKQQESDVITSQLSALIEDEGVSVRGFILLNRLGELLVNQNKNDEAYLCLQRALTMGRTLFGSNLNFNVVITLQLLGTVSTRLLMYEESKFYFGQLIKLLPSLAGLAPLLITKSVHHSMAIIFANTNDHKEAISHLQKGLELPSNGTGTELTLDCVMYCHMATSWNKLGAHEKAWQSASDAEKCLRSVENEKVRVALTCFVFQTYMEVGKNEDVILQLEERFQELHSQPDSEVKVQYLNSLGELSAQRGLTEDAERYYKKALEILRIKNSNTFGIVENLLEISNILLENKKPLEAISYVDEAWKYASTAVDNDQKCMYLTKIAEYWEKLGKSYHARRCYKQALKICTKSVLTHKVPLKEFDLHVKLGDLVGNNSSSVSNTVGMSTEQLMNVKRMHYDQAGNVLRRHSASGNFHSTTVLLFMGLASKYHCIDLWEREKLLLEALKMSEEIYESDQVSEIVANVLSSLSDVYFERKDYATAIEFLDRSLKMEMELHSSDPYHPHITQQISDISSLYLGCPGSKKLEDAVQSLLKFLESLKEEEMSINDAAKANYFVTMANFMVVCLDDFARAETLNQMASDIFTTIQKTNSPVDVPLYTSLCDTMKRVLEIWKANPGVQPLVKMALSSGLLSSLFGVNTTNEASSSLIGEISIGNLLGMCTDENNPSRINTEEKPPDVPVRTSGIVSTLSSTDPITGNDDMMSTFSKAVSGDSKFYEKSTFSSEGSNASAEERVSPPAHTAQTIKTVTAGIEDVNVTIDQIKPTLIKSPEVPQENSDRAIGNVAFQELPVEPASTLQCDSDSERHVIPDSPKFLLAGTSNEQDKQNEVSFKHEKEKNGAISVGPLGYPTFGENLEPAKDTEEWLQNKAQDPETLQTMDILTCVGDSIIYDLNKKNLEDAGKNIEEGFFPLMMSFLDKISSAGFVPSGAQFSPIDEAVKARDNNDITLMPQYLQLAAKYPLNPERKAMCSKLWGEFHLHQENYRMAAISFSEAITCYRSFSKFDYQIEYAGSLIGLTKSYMLCNDLQSAWSACQEGIAVVSTGELESTSRLLVQLFYLAAKCTIQLSEHSPTQDRDLEPAVSFCQHALATTEVVDQFHESSDLTDELSGLEKGDFFALKCEIKLLLAKTLCRLKKSDEARKIMREMNEFLGNIVVVLETYSKDTWPGGEVEFYKIQRRFFSWVGQTLVMSGEANAAVNPLMRSLALFFSPSVPVTICPPEELLALLDAVTVTKEATAHQEYSPFRETLELCKHQYLKQRDDLKELQEFFGNLGNHYVDCGRIEEAIVSYETGLTVAECIEHSDANNTRGQMLLYLANAHRLQAIQSTGKGAVEESRLAESYYKTGRETKDFSIDMYADFLCDEGRFNEAVSVLVNLTKAGNRLWDKYCITSYSKRALFGRGVQKYMESHGKLATPIGNLAYSGLVRAYVGMGTKKEAVAAYEKLSSSGKDLRHTPFGNRPPLLPYLLSSCQKGLLSLVEDQSYLQFNDSDFPLSEGNLAKVFYELGEYELTLSCCQKARTMTEPSQSKDTEAMDFQSELSSLRLTGNALVMLGRENESYSYFFSFLESLQRQEKILDKPFHEVKVFLGQYSFARLYYIYRSLGVLLAGQGNIDSAIECGKYCLELDPDYNCDQNIVGTLAELYQTKAFSASEDKATYQKWMDTAQECFDGVISRNIKLTPFVEAAFASFLSRTQRPIDSIVHFEQLLDGADSVISFSGLDKPLVGAYLEREIQARGQLELPLKIYVYNQLAMAYLKCNEVENAQESARRMEEYAAGFESSPHSPAVLSVLGYTYKEIGNERKAVKIFNAVLKMCPDHAPVKLALANCRTGEKEEQSSDQRL